MQVADRDMLVAAHDELVAELAKRDFAETVLHGDAHLGNVCFTTGGPLWLDFEDVCIGPREWDIARFGEAHAFDRVDRRLLELLAVLRSFCVATWCWADAVNVEHARHHTAIVRAWSRAQGATP
jgi:aminoglycoside phosphotransferase (APT) family kinase protein